jgi:hypothetical protein
VERIVAWYRVASSTGAVVALVVANLIPLVGVIWFGWNVWTILIVYWLENGIVGVFNIAKMWLAEGPLPDGAASSWRFNGRPMNEAGRMGLITFFAMHYGIFWFVHGVFVLTFPLFAGIGGTTDMTEGVNPVAIILAGIALFISHAVSFWLNFIGHGEYRRVSAAGQMFAPYGRLVILHITIIVGGIAISMTGAPAAAVAILVVLKTVLDIGFHLAEHRRVPQPASARAAIRSDLPSRR